MSKILVTGAAGFIGFHLCKKLIKDGFSVIGIDNLNSYYDIKLKHDRLRLLFEYSQANNNNFIFEKIDIQNDNLLKSLFINHQPSKVVNLAAQAGVRYSLENPKAYINSNIVGFQNIIDCCKNFKIENFIYASSSSVYGGNTKIPFSEDDPVDHPCSLYAATKRSNELIAHTYSHLYELPSTGLRFFTVYGPWGRPDMAPMIFANSILKNKPIKIFNGGDMSRDFTYIDDIIFYLVKILNKPAYSDFSFKKDNPSPCTSWSPHRIFNIGNSQKISLMNFIEILEEEIGKKAIKEYSEMQPGDVKDTLSDTKKIELWTDFVPKTALREGIKEFINWYIKYLRD